MPGDRRSTGRGVRGSSPGSATELGKSLPLLGAHFQDERWLWVCFGTFQLRQKPHEEMK